MKQLLLIAIISIFSALLGIGLTKDPGYILVVFHHWQIETSLFLAILILVVLTASFIFSYQFLKDLLNVPVSLFKKFRQWQRYRAERVLNQGLQAFYQGKWHQALKNIRAQQEHSTWSTDLIAAEAAQKDGAYAQRDDLIHHALANNPQAKESILLFQAKLQIEQRQFEQAQATLKTIAQLFPKPSYQWVVLQLHVHHHFQEYEAGLTLLNCQRHLFVHDQEYLNRYLDFFMPVLEQNLHSNQMDKSLDAYQNLPKNLQNNISILKSLAPFFPEHRLIRNRLEKRLNEQCDDEILEIISLLPPSNYWLKKLEKIRSEQPHHAMLYYTFGKIEAGLKLWGSAIADLQKSIQMKPRYQSYTLLAQVYMDLNEPSNALKALQHAIECPVHEQ
jgi:HemY protein